MRKIIYVRDSDADDSSVKTEVENSWPGLLFAFGAASTPTSISVAGVTETKFVPWVITGKPSFVDKVYSVTYVVTYDSTKTVVNLPMVTIVNKDTGYLSTVYKDGDQVKWYPEGVSFNPYMEP